jgi:diacylglycerol kinase family enzyme
VVLIANAKSGTGGADRVAGLLREHGAEPLPVPFERVCTEPADRVARDVAGAERVVVAGGDGSIGPAASLAAAAGIPLAVAPAGTANDFARFVGLPLDVPEAIALATTRAPRLRPMELALADGRPFVNAASAGLSVLAARHARPLKGRLGPLAYAVGAARAGATGRPLPAIVVVDGEEAWRGKAWQVVVAVTGAFGGGSGTGGVETEDRALDVAIVEAGSRAALVLRAFAMRRGRLVHEDDVAHLRGREIRLALASQGVMNVDGEVLPAPADFRVAGTFQVVEGE